MAIDLAKALDALTDTWCARMPDEVAKLEGDDSIEPFDCYDDEQCGRVLRHLLYTANRGSLLRVVFGLSVVLNKRNRYVAPETDTIERHPDAVAGLAAKTPRPLADWHEEDGPVLWWRMPVEEPPYCGIPLADDWRPGYHTHWTPILVPDAPPGEVPPGFHSGSANAAFKALPAGLPETIGAVWIENGTAGKVLEEA